MIFGIFDMSCYTLSKDVIRFIINGRAGNHKKILKTTKLCRRKKPETGVFTWGFRDEKGVDKRLKDMVGSLLSEKGVVIYV